MNDGSKSQLLTGASLAFATIALVSSIAAGSSCAATPAQQAQLAKVQVDLCRLRLVAAALEGVSPELQPPAGSVRAQLEAAEDLLCAEVLDAGTTE